MSNHKGSQVRKRYINRRFTPINADKDSPQRRPSTHRQAQGGEDNRTRASGRAESAENFSFVCRERATNKTLAIADNNRTTKRKAIREEGQQVFVFFTPARSEARIEQSIISAEDRELIAERSSKARAHGAKRGRHSKQWAVCSWQPFTDY